MRRKKLHIKRATLLIGLCLCIELVNAQITINLPQANIQSGTDYDQRFSAGRFVSVLGLIPGFRVNANTPTFSNVTTGGIIPLYRANISLISVGSVSVLGAGQEQPLSTSPSTLYNAVATLLSGDITANARIPVSGFPWIAGVYSSNVTFSLSGVNLGTITPGSQNFNITVPGFISVQPSVGTTSILLNDLSYYRSAAGISANKVIAIGATVAYIPSVQAGSSQFSFATSLPYNTLPVAPVSAVSAGLASVPSATSAALSVNNQALTSAVGIQVSTNAQSLTNTYTIAPAALKSNFLQAGTYSVPLNYSWSKLASVYPAGSLQTQATGTLEVVVSDLTEIVASQQVINLDFNSVSDYTSGVIIDVPSHLRLSKTTPYNLTVRASSSTFTSSGNSIPLSVLRIGPAGGKTGMNTVTLSAAAQPIIVNANPEIDRNISLRYSIPASQTEHLMGVPSGSYSADIIFGVVAP